MKSKILKIINPIMAILFLLVLSAAVFHKQIPHDSYELLHVIPGFLLSACIILHFILNWGWVKQQLKKK